MIRKANRAPIESSLRETSQIPTTIVAMPERSPMHLARAPTVSPLTLSLKSSPMKRL